MTREELLAVIEAVRRSGQTKLDLTGKEIEELPEEIGQLTNLKSLNLQANELTSLPQSIGNLTNLISLNLDTNALTSLPESIAELKKLTYLNIDNNHLSSMPRQFLSLTSLKELSINKNSFKLLPRSITYLYNLRTLDARANEISVIPDSIKELRNLSRLDLSGNTIWQLPKAIGQLVNLTTLRLNNNRLQELPPSIGKLSNLMFLDLPNNRIKRLPESLGELISLKSLDVRSNDLRSLPDSIIKLKRLRNLDIRRNSFTDIPPEIVRKGGLAVLDYYRQRLEEKADHIYEAKLLILGEGGAGKTSLANKLIDPSYTLKLEGSSNPEKSTEGIDVLHLDFPHPSGNPFHINLWDFGGQEIYHATHQFFLTKRSLYLLVADTRQENTDFNYWLEIVELLTDASPTLIIKNEKQDRPCQVNENQLRERFPNLEKILPTNLATNRGLAQILPAVQHHISQLPHIGQPLPKTWVNVRKALETDPRNYITQDEFLTLCDTHGFKRHPDKLQLSGYLHDLGVCLHFQEDDLLQRYIILKPEWGTTAVYKVLDTPKVRNAFGHFTSEDLKTIWADAQYAPMRPELLQLMKNFKLCYEIPHKPKTYIAPQLLSPNQPEYTWNDTDNLILRYHYEFMPKGMITRFIVEMHRLIDRPSSDRELVWKDGVILADKDARAEVIEARYRNEIRIRIAGKLKKPLLEGIRHEFRKIHDSYGDRLRYQEYIPCNCSTCKGSQTPHSYALKRLEERLRNNRHEIECDISYQMVSVRGLIDDAIISPDDQEDRDRSITNNYYVDNHYGDRVGGDKMGRDKVGGDAQYFNRKFQDDES